jgi:hypothetical protein
MTVIVFAPPMVITIAWRIGVVSAVVWSAVIALIVARRANPDAYSARRLKQWPE